MILAAGLNTPEIALKKEEAEGLAKAMAEVAKYYPTAIDGKTIAWVNLATCVGLTYGPRVYMVNARKNAERKAKRGPKPAPAPATGTEASVAETFHMSGMEGYIGPVADATTI